MRAAALILVLLGVTAHAQDPDAGVDAGETPTTATTDARLRVVVAGNAPFVLPGEDLDGISVRIWQDLAEQIERDFELERAESVADALEKVRSGEADVAIGPISITAERARRVAFTQPYYESAISILAPMTTPSVWQRLRPFFSGPFLKGVGVFFLFMLIVGHLLWRAERRRNDDFPETAIAGTGVGLWLVVVTLTTVGYGDTAPKTAKGRFLAGFFMLVSMISVSSLTAFLATALTVGSLEHGAISRANDLVGRDVAAVPGSTGAEFAEAHGAELVAVDDVGAAVESCRAGAADAVVYDRPMLLHALQTAGADELTVSPASYEPQGYGFAVSHENVALESALDIGLLQLAEDGVIDRVVSRWLGDTED